MLKLMSETLTQPPLKPTRKGKAATAGTTATPGPVGYRPRRLSITVRPLPAPLKVPLKLFTTMLFV